jgi:hypothetical protein
MAIVIREIIASDSISQAVDKINFNFDQFLINGGGPQGPIGPAGPIGPIGNTGPVGPNGQRGTGWYIGDGDPNLLTFTTVPINNDLYLDKVSGFVWYYDISLLPLDAWINTSSSLLGPGNILYQIDGSDPNISGSIPQFQFRYIQPSANLSIDTSGLTNSQSLLVGASPIGAPETAGISPPDDTVDTISDTYAASIGTGVGSIFAHAPKRITGSNIVLSRILGDGTTNFNTDNVLQMATLRVDNYDGLFVEAPRLINSSLKYTQPRGIYLGADDSDIEVHSGRNITIQTSLPTTSYSSGIFGSNTGNGIIRLIAPESSSMGYSGSAIRLLKGSGGGGYGHAYLSLGTSDPSLQPAVGSGEILLKNTTGDSVTIDSSGSLLAKSGGVTRISLSSVGVHTYSGTNQYGTFSGEYSTTYGSGYTLTAASYAANITGAAQIGTGGTIGLINPFTSRIILGAALNGAVNTGRIYISKNPNPSTVTVAEQSGYDLTFRSVSGFSGGTTLPEGTRFGRISAQKNFASSIGLANNIDVAGISFEADAGYSAAGAESTRIAFSVLRNSAATGMEERMRLDKFGHIVFNWDDAKTSGTTRYTSIYPRQATSNENGSFVYLLGGKGALRNDSSGSTGGALVLSGGDGTGVPFTFTLGTRGNIYMQPPSLVEAQTNSYGAIGIGKAVGTYLAGSIDIQTYAANIFSTGFNTIYVQEGSGTYPWFKVGGPSGFDGSGNNYAVEVRAPQSAVSGYWGVGLFSAKNAAGTTKFGLDWDGALRTGLQFPATQVSSADANNLDDYEEGDMTTGVTSGGSPVGVVYVSNGAVAIDVTTLGMNTTAYLSTTGLRYIKIGRMVNCQIQFNANFDILSGTYDTYRLFIKLPFANSSTNRGTSMWYRNVGLQGATYNQTNINRLAMGFGKIEVLTDIVYAQPMKNVEYSAGVYSADGLYVSELKADYSSSNTFEFACSLTYHSNN